ncbi:transglycosylase SLT domain-containing protein [Chondromyces apiculatus]|uniref:Membrane-bound lytic murein transglycosylase D n=1 Tax=Chondromyces apiculatus DSM 436 TaxID=1192034 RepID=A0A017SVH6_9BACT|nr:transglycosylase SLT domain-containing protein [Chondromyces apiculatus]EYF00580.1 Membrane-bound lytic murein transglycosylase D precursor [Chondromyces apiculatus DSM 436]
MRQSARRAAYAIGLGTIVGVTIGAAGASTSLKASFRAAYRAFQDPGLLEGRAPAAAQAAEHPPIVCATATPTEDPEAMKAWIKRDFEAPADEDLDDPEGATIASLTMPDLRVPLTRRTMRFVRFFGRTEEGRAAFLQRYRRASAYREVIEHALREAGLPEDLLWLAGIESSFDPRAVSPAGAAGLWQFMPRTGDTYGLYRDAWVDERRSLVKATTAAVAHLRDLHERFGRWDLALAAYNAGYERILDAMERVTAARDPSERGPIGVAELAQAGAIPNETASYVPQIMAFALIASNRTRFGLDQADLEKAKPLEMGEIAVPAGTRLRTLARAAGVSTAVLREFNPQLLRDRVPPTGGEYLVSLPADRVGRTLATFPAYHEHEEVAGSEEGSEGGDGGESAEVSWGAGLGGVEGGVEGGAEGGGARGVVADFAEEGLPARPSTLGRNRLPAFFPPGQLPSAMPLFGDPRGAEARLPVMVVGGGVGWQRNFEEDPLGILSGRPPRPSRLKGREALIEKQILGALGEERLPRLWLPGGVAVEIRRDAAAAFVAVSVGMTGAEVGGKGADGARAGVGPMAVGEARYTLTVQPKDLDVGLSLVAGRLRLLLGESSPERLAALRRQAGKAQREGLLQAPYGRAWLSLGEALFPAGHALEGLVIGARDNPEAARDLLVAESLRRERLAAHPVVSISGDLTRAQVEEALGRTFGAVQREAEAPVGAHPREERVLVEDAVPAPRLLYGWIGVGEGEPGEASLRVAMEILVGTRIARLSKALVAEGQVASEVKGRLDMGPRASVAALEIAPGVGKEAPTVEQRLEAELGALAMAGPSWNEMALAKVLLKQRIERELGRGPGKAGSGGGAGSAGSAGVRGGEAAGGGALTGMRLREALSPGSVERLLRDLEDVSPATVRSAVRKTFERRHRVVVMAWPRGAAAVAAAGGPLPSAASSAAVSGAQSP